MLYPLTKARSKAAVPLAGKYRYIDIPLSNCLNSGLNRVYVLTQFQSVSLHRHIANTYKFDPFSRGFVEVLAAQVTNEAADWYRGNADAVRQNLRYFEDDAPRDVLILSDDLLYRFDFRLLVEAHRSAEADVTLMVAPVNRDQARALGVVGVDAGGDVTAFVEKPQADEQLARMRAPAEWLRRRSVADPTREWLGNVGIYLFRRDVLFELLQRELQGHDLTTDLFPGLIRRFRLQPYLYTGYWEHLDSIGAYHAAHMALASDRPPFEFHTPEGVVYTRMRNLPASRVSAGRLEQCLISDGCVVGPNAVLERSVVGVRSIIGRDVRLREAVVMGANLYESEPGGEAQPGRGLPSLGIGDGSVLERVVVDKHCRIGCGVHIVNRRGVRDEDGENYVIRDGIVVIPDGAVIPDGTVI
jgi:glucose-1-phosphate adenylyltransferase